MLGQSVEERSLTVSSVGLRCKLRILIKEILGQMWLILHHSEVQTIHILCVLVFAWVSHKIILIDKLEHIHVTSLAKHFEQRILLIWHQLLGVTTFQIFEAQLAQILSQVGQVTHLQNRVDMCLLQALFVFVRHRNFIISIMIITIF